MIPITRQDILAHQAVVPWVAQYQVEQDLLLCRAMVALFDDKFRNSQIAMRGGTLLHKVHLAPPARYSEDIDLVVVGTRPPDHIRRANCRELDGIFGALEKSNLVVMDCRAASTDLFIDYFAEIDLPAVLPAM